MNKHFRKKHLTKFVLFPKFPELDFLLTSMGKRMHTKWFLPKETFGMMDHNMLPEKNNVLNLGYV